MSTSTTETHLDRAHYVTVTEDALIVDLADDVLSPYQLPGIHGFRRASQKSEATGA